MIFALADVSVEINVRCGRYPDCSTWAVDQVTMVDPVKVLLVLAVAVCIPTFVLAIYKILEHLVLRPLFSAFLVSYEDVCDMIICELSRLIGLPGGETKPSALIVEPYTPSASIDNTFSTADGQMSSTDDFSMEKPRWDSTDSEDYAYLNTLSSFGQLDDIQLEDSVENSTKSPSPLKGLVLKTPSHKQRRSSHDVTMSSLGCCGLPFFRWQTKKVLDKLAN
uniref:Col_cuticle_N domain-containing protein n=1 Tax=Steinernema glaseri TaxID=37863 RepID=A0A1I8ACM4_9BILA